MPNQYENPTSTPCGGGYTWVPQPVGVGTKGFGGPNPVLGFDSMVIDRGKFRNYYVPVTGAPAVTVTTNGDSEGNPYSPIMNATRPLDLYTTAVKFANNNNFVGFSKKKDDSSTLIAFTFPSIDVFKPISCIEIIYDLSFWQLNLPDNFTDISNCKAVDLVGVYASGITTVIATVYPTRIRANESEPNIQYSTGDNDTTSFQTIKIKTASDKTDRSAYPKFKQVYFRSNYTPSSLAFALKKIMFFSADRVNLRFSTGQKQLPCSAIGYSMLISGTLFPASSYVSVINVSSGQLGFSGSTDSSGVFTWPTNDRLIGCNCHVKIFSPDYTTGSPGFAQSLNLHMMVLSFPTFGPLADAFGFPQPYYGVIVGPAPFVQQFAFKGTSGFGTTPTYDAVTLISNLKPTIGTYTVTGIADADPFDILPLKDILTKKISPSYEINSGSITSYTNIFVDQYGIETPSDPYSGMPARATTFLSAYDVITGVNPVKKTFTYQSQILYDEAKLSDVFSNPDIEPCLIFKLNKIFGDISALTLQPGFISASVNCFKTDSTGVFDSKLIYRVYALAKTPAPITYDASSSKYQMKIINDGSKDSPNLLFTQYDNSWTFDNVLISGNLEADLQTIYAEILINAQTNDFNITAENKGFDLYVAIYSVCEVNESLKNINFKDKSSFDLPLVNFTIGSDFNIALPIYYAKSFAGGGSIQAIRDFGYTGNYTSDANVYTLTSQLYNGSTFDNTKSYGTVVGSSGFSDLLTFSPTPPIGGGLFFISLPEGSATNPFTSETDYFIITSDLSNSLVNDGDWIIAFSFNSDLKKALIKLEIDLINTQTSTLVLKVLTTPYQTLSGGVAEFRYTVTIPFSLSPLSTGLILKLFIQNSGGSGKVTFNSAKITKTTLQFFNYSGNKPPVSAPLGFYEDMPLQPSSFVGECTDFLLYLDLPSEGYVIFDPTVGLFINGALYSPTWIVSLPENMEVTYKTDLNDSGIHTFVSGVTPYKLFFRTGQANSIVTVDTKKGGGSKLFTTVVNKKVGGDDYAVKQYTSESYLRFSTFSQTILTPLSNLNLTRLNLQYPVLAKTSELYLIGQSNQFSKTASVLYNMNSPYSFVAQPAPFGTLKPTDDSKYIIERMNGCVYVSTDAEKETTYNLGVTPHGNLLYSSGTLKEGNDSFLMQFIDGDASSPELAMIGAAGASSNFTTGKVNVAFPGIINLDGTTLIFYSSAGSTKILARDLTTVGGSYVIFDINEFCPGAPPVNNIITCKEEFHPKYKLFNIAFDCGGKIFVIKVNYRAPSFFVYMLCLVYGSLTSKQTAFDLSLNTAINSSLIRKLNMASATGQTIFYDKDLEGNQKIGFVDYNGIYMGIQFLVGTNVVEVVFGKSYSELSELRVIGKI